MKLLLTLVWHWLKNLGVSRWPPGIEADKMSDYRQKLEEAGNLDERTPALEADEDGGITPVSFQDFFRVPCSHSKNEPSYH